MPSETVFSSAMSNTMQWALGYPVSAGHYAFTFLLVVGGGAYLFQTLASTFNARRYAWLFVGPSWGIGLFAIVVGMSSALVNQPEGMAGSSRFVTCLMGAVIAVVAVAGPTTMLIMSVGYGAAVSIWLTIMAAIGIVGAASTLVGAGTIQGSPKVLHWQGEVSMVDERSPVPKQMTDDRRILGEDDRLITSSKSAAIVMVRGHQILVMPDSIIRIASLDEDEPRVALERGRMFSRTSMAANGNMRFETSTVGLKISNGSVLMIAASRGTWVVVADGGIYAGRTVFDAEEVVKKGNYITASTAIGITPPQPLTQENKDTLKQLTRYFENPFSEPNRALISGATVRSREEEEKDEGMKKSDETKSTTSTNSSEMKGETKSEASSEMKNESSDDAKAKPEDGNSAEKQN